MAGLLALVGSVMLTAGIARAEDRVYWVNTQTSTIAFSPLSGGQSGAFSTGTLRPAFPSGLAFDRSTQQIFWSNVFSGKISFANLAGSESENLETDAATVAEPSGLTIDPVGERAYWANELGGKISFASLDGSLGGNLAIAAPAVVASPTAVAIDGTTGRIYWTNGAGGGSPVSFAKLDGSGGGVLNATGATVNGPFGIAIDDAAGRVYWANSGLGKISYANLDGSGGGDLATGAATVLGATGLALDPVAHRIYWANGAGGKISYANLDGSGGQDLTITGTPPAQPEFPMLLESPHAAGAATVSGGSRVGSILTCTGNWVPDHPEDAFYDAPDSLSYQWSRDGADLAGATKPRLRATTIPGNYSCRVTATNQAGQAVETGGPRALKPVAFGKRELVSLKLAPRTVSAAGKLKIRVTNANAFPIKGRLEGTVAKTRGKLRSKRFTVGAHAKTVLRVTLPGPLRHLLAARGRIRLSCEANVTDLAGNERTVEKTLVAKVKR